MQNGKSPQNKEKTFTHKELSQSTMEDLTEESVLSGSPQPEVHIQIMDNSIPESYVQDEPIYAMIDQNSRKAKGRQEVDEVCPEVVVETPANESIESVEEVTFETHVKEVGDISSQTNGYIDNPEGVSNEKEELHVETSTVSDMSSKYEKEHLGYAFNFLKSYDTQGETSMDGTYSDLLTETKAENKIENGNGDTVHSENLNSPRNNSTHIDKPTPMNNRSLVTQDVRMNDKNHVVVPTSNGLKTAVDTPESDSDGYQSDSGPNDLSANSPVRPSQLFRELKNEGTVSTQDDGNEARKIRNYQPKFLVELNRFFKENSEKGDISQATVNNNRIVNGGDFRKHTNYGVNEHFNHSRYENDTPTFDATPSMEHRYANFSVNDILRQSYLPTTRLDHNSLASVSDEYHQHESFDDTPFGRKKDSQLRKDVPISKLSSLNIQNQYQYETSERNRIRSSGFEEVTKIDETKYYGKPVMSPKTDLLSTSWEKENIKKKIPEINLNTTIEANHVVSDNDKRTIQNPQLRKTKNSELFLGIKNKTEDDGTTTEDFIKATNIAEYLSSDQTQDSEYKPEPPSTKSKIPIFESKALSKTLLHSDYDNSSSYEFNHSSKELKYEAKHPYLVDADFRATDELDIPDRTPNNSSYSSKITHQNSFTDFRSTDDESKSFGENSNDSVDNKILSIKSRIEAFSRNGGIHHLKKEIQRLNGPSNHSEILSVRKVSKT